MVEKEIDWNSCVPFTGPESGLPTGISYMPARVTYEDLIEPGSIIKLPSGGIIDLNVNEQIYNKLIDVYGPRALLIGTADGERVTRIEWYNLKDHTDGLKLAIIKHCNQKIAGPGVHIPRG